MTPDDTVDFRAKAQDSSEDLTLKVAMADYDRIRPLMDGRVRPDGITLDITTDDIREFCVGPAYETFDVAEMSMSWYVAARARGEPCIALPIFPLRMAVLGYIYCHADAPTPSPATSRASASAARPSAIRLISGCAACWPSITA